jgi:hypothetical protein
MLAHLLPPSLLRSLAAAGCLAVAGAPGRTADPPPPPAQPVALADVALAREALAALDADPVLKNVNLIVSVKDRGAVIGGPVAHDDIKKRAEAVVRAVPGIASVKNACFVDADADPLMRAAAARLKNPPAPDPVPTVLPLVGAPTAPGGALPPLPPVAPTDLVALKPNAEVVAQRPPLGPPVGLLGAPTAIAPVKAPAGGAVAPGALAAHADSLAAAQAIRKADARFARATVEPKPNGALFVSGWVADPAHALALAEKLRELPGVKLVVVDPVLVK